MGLAEATTSSRIDGMPIALVLPTVADLQSEFMERFSSWVRIGEEGRPGMHKPTAILSWLRAQDPPRLLISHADQLCSPRFATIRLLLPDRTEFISPIEIILNTRYGFQLLVWTSDGLIRLPPGSSPKAVAASLASHLRDCDTLGDGWIERSRQVERTLLHRVASGRKQLRFLRSCVANAFSNSSDNSAMTPILDRIDGIERSFEEAFAR